jgi:CheY-like chemotaxis protein
MQIHCQAAIASLLPLEEGPDAASWLAPSSFKILIVNEDMRSADSLKRQLHDLGYPNTYTAYSARRALMAAVEFSPAIALLDLELPDMTGYQLARKLRSHRSQDVRRMPLLAVAELPGSGNAELTRAAGFMGCLSKPVNLMALDTLLNRLQAAPTS